MASELSRLIDDELEKFERRPSANEQPNQKATFGVKVVSCCDYQIGEKMYLRSVAASEVLGWCDGRWWVL